MPPRHLQLIPWLAWLALLTSCTSPGTDRVWVEPRPLGREMETYRPPRDPPEAGPQPAKLENPSGTLTLREALSLTLLQSPGLQGFSWEVRAAEARTLQAGLLPNPEIEVEAEELAGSGELGGVDAVAASVQLSQLVELGGKRGLRTRVATLETDLAGWDYEARRLDAVTATAQAFVRLLVSQRRLSLLEDADRLAQQVLATVSERVKSGKVSPLEEVRARVTRSTTGIAVEGARRQLNADRRALAANWGSTAPEFARASGELEVAQTIPTAEQLARRLSANPDLARWAAELRRSQAAVELEESGAIPDLTVSGGAQWFEETRDHAFVVGLSIPLPAFDRNQGSVREAQSQLAGARRMRREAQVRVRADLAARYQALAFSHAEARALEKDVLPSAQQVFDATQESYRQGKSSYLELLDAQRDLLDVKGQYLDAIGRHHAARIDVERLIGQGLHSAVQSRRPRAKGEKR